ncbi:hypothetical protein [Pontibacter mangrovi]|uniref:Uncharacterized protein n=1 Tax=Pontibacter mangrovi TaxID=2589816 RepID=A0A501W4P3_9BACT|nr:hypothetical protein [Pontibacter mangrovi]TPE43625.1 hypothetical protein FJM65_12780 [Pontibacter mangrovi]
MKQLSYQSPKVISCLDKKILKERLDNKRNLLYVASGRRIREGYEDLPFDNIVLVDKCFPEVIAIKGNVICIGLDSVRAGALMKEVGARLDAYVCINEGLSEGNGFYPIHGNWSFSNILPILKDEYLHIACPSYYGLRKWKKKHFNLPQEATLLSEKDDEYIDPKIFSEYYRYNKEFCVYKVRKKPGESAKFRLGNRTISVQWQNMWEQYNELDSLFVRCSPLEAHNLKSVAPKIEILKDYSFEQILQFCNRNKIEKLGLSPWLRGEYNKFLEFLEANKEHEYPKQIHFYHLHKNDFQQLYERAEQYRMSCLPYQ